MTITQGDGDLLDHEEREDLDDDGEPWERVDEEGQQWVGWNLDSFWVVEYMIGEWEGRPVIGELRVRPRQDRRFRDEDVPGRGLRTSTARVVTENANCSPTAALRWANVYTEMRRLGPREAIAAMVRAKIEEPVQGKILRRSPLLLAYVAYVRQGADEVEDPKPAKYVEEELRVWLQGYECAPADYDLKPETTRNLIREARTNDRYLTHDNRITPETRRVLEEAGILDDAGRPILDGESGP